MMTKLYVNDEITLFDGTFVSETSKILILREKFNINFLPVSREMELGSALRIWDRREKEYSGALSH
jgi:hypothetical protein